MRGFVATRSSTSSPTKTILNEGRGEAEWNSSAPYWRIRWGVSDFWDRWLFRVKRGL